MRKTSRCHAATRSAFTPPPADPSKCGSYPAHITLPLSDTSPKSSAVAPLPSSTPSGRSRFEGDRAHVLHPRRPAPLRHLQHQKYPVIFVGAAAGVCFHFVPYAAQDFSRTLPPALGHRFRQPRAAVLVAGRIHRLGDAVGAGPEQIGPP